MLGHGRRAEDRYGYHTKPAKNREICVDQRAMEIEVCEAFKYENRETYSIDV